MAKNASPLTNGLIMYILAPLFQQARHDSGMSRGFAGLLIGVAAGFG
jgi:hypothetical protein